MPRDDSNYEKYVYDVYNPIEVGSIDRTDTEPHDRAIVRAIFSEYVPNKLVKGDPEYTIFIARLNPRTTQDTIESEFSKFGKVKRCRLVKDIVTGKSKKYAFLEYDNKHSVDAAMKEMHHEYLDGAEIIVDREVERRLKGWKPRRLGGGFGGRKESGQLRFGCLERPFRRPYVVPTKSESTSNRH